MPYPYNPFTSELDKIADVSGFADTFETDSGTANPLAGVIIIAGGIAIDTAGAGNTVTINFDITGAPDIATSFVTDAGTATPVLNSLNILGGTGINTSAAGDTVTINLDTPVIVADGGSGRASSIAYSVICGGTTSTNPHQSVASVGNATQVLASNGPGFLPSFQDGFSNEWTEVDAITASDDPEIIFTDLTTFDFYRFQFESLLPATNSVTLLLTASLDNGSTYLSTLYWSSQAVSFLFNATEWRITSSTGQGNSANNFLLGNMVFSRNVEGSEYPMYSGFSYYEASGGADIGGSIYGLNIGAGTSDVDALRFAYASGNIASGTIRLFGR